MATTDAKPGFRLPWSSERSDSAAPADVSADAPADAPAADPATPAQETETPTMIDAAPATPDQAVIDTDAGSTPTHTPVAFATPAPTRKPNKFMADLSKAMQSAAETAREDTLSRVNSEAKGFIESIHATSAEEATELRKKADDDVASIRDWSKAEIARIREETDERIAHRKTALERDVEAHAAAIETRIERVQARVTAFEGQMAAFFERLLAEDDPTRFAAMAESLPEPPPFDTEDVDSWPLPVAEVVDSPAPVEAIAEVAPADAALIEAVAEPVAEAFDTRSIEVVPSDSGHPAADDAAEATAGAGAEWGAAPQAADDPRLEVLGLAPDFAAAEAEAASFSTTDDGSDESVPEFTDDDIASRLAGLVAPEGSEPETATTRVVVTGLVSVASIAGFKRHLSRAEGITSVGVSSGPDGEFVFAVGHRADVALRDIVPTLPGFAARVTGEADGELVVAAHDPESEG
jgi:hypothetical protein